MEHRITTFYFYIGANNIQCGPVLRSQLVALGVTPDTFVWKEGMADWQQAKFVEDLNQIWTHRCYDSQCCICRLDDSAICKDCKEGSLFSLCESISPNWLLRQPKGINSFHKESYVPSYIPQGVLYGPMPTNNFQKENFDSSTDTDIQPTVYGVPVNLGNERYHPRPCVYGPPPLLQMKGWRTIILLLAIIAVVMFVFFTIC